MRSKKKKLLTNNESGDFHQPWIQQGPDNSFLEDS